MLDLHGCLVALVTPFSGGRPDLHSLRQHASRLLADGVHGLVPCGTTGEAATLADDEFVAVVGTVVDAAAGRVPVVAGSGTNCTAQTIARTRLAAQAGADAALVVVPPYNKPTPEGQFRHFAAVADAVDLPLVLYNVPSRVGTNLLPQTVRRLVAECPRIVGLKEASGDLAQVSVLLRDVGSRLAVLAGDDAWTLPLMALGARGVVSVAGNVAPAAMVALVEHVESGRLPEARRLHGDLLDLFSALFAESNPIPVKTALSLLGRMPGEFRLPLCAAQPETAERLRLVLERLRVL